MGVAKSDTKAQYSHMSSCTPENLVLQVLTLRAVGHHSFLIKFYLNSAVVDTELVLQLLICNVEDFLWVISLFWKKRSFNNIAFENNSNQEFLAVDTSHQSDKYGISYQVH